MQVVCEATQSTDTQVSGYWNYTHLLTRKINEGPFKWGHYVGPALSNIFGIVWTLCWIMLADVSRAVYERLVYYSLDSIYVETSDSMVIEQLKDVGLTCFKT